jgi:hypothetical protein
MNERTKSIVRHVLTGLGAILAFFGITAATGVIEYTLVNLDTVWNAIIALLGFVTTVIGFFKNKERLVERTAVK